jgi:hypothetical protein
MTEKHQDEAASAAVGLFREMRSTLGVWAPWILVLVIFGFGFYKFEELRATYLDDVKDTLVEIRESYRAMGELNKQQIANFKESLEIREQLDAKLNELGGLAAKRTKALQEIQTRLGLAQAEVAAAEQQRREAEQARARAGDELKQTRQEIERSKQELQRRAVTLGNLREELSRLAAITRDAVGPGSPNYDEVAGIIARSVVDPVAMLASYFAAPSESNAAALSDLVGIERAHLPRLVETNQGFGATLWLEGTLGPGEAGSMIVVAGEQDESEYRHLIGFDTQDGRINEAEFAFAIFAARLPDTRDWLRERAASFIVIGEEEVESEWWEEDPGRGWTLTDFVQELSQEEEADFRVLHGADRPKQFLGPDALRTALSRTEGGRGTLRQTYRTPALNLAMIERAADFEAVLRRADLQRVPASLQSALEGLLRAAVTRDLEAADVHIAAHLNPEVIGEGAAAALRPGFAVAEVRRPEPPPQLQVQQQPLPEQPPAAEATPRLLVLTRYRIGPAPDELGHAAFTFEREDEGAPWRLVEFLGGHGAELGLPLATRR